MLRRGRAADFSNDRHRCFDNRFADAVVASFSMLSCLSFNLSSHVKDPVVETIVFQLHMCQSQTQPL